MGNDFTATAASGGTEPVTLAEAKTHMRVDSDDENTYIGSLITAAREFVEERQRRQLIYETRYRYFDAFPEGEIIIPYPPLVSVTSITYYDDTDSEQTLSSSYYQADTSNEPGRIKLNYGYAWPSTYLRMNAVTVTYVGGYADTADIPDSTKQAILMLVAHWFENREHIITGTIVSEVPMAVEALINIEHSGMGLIG